MMKHKRTILIAILFAVFLSGCGDQRELSELGVIGAVSYDWNLGETNATLHVLQQDGNEEMLVDGNGPGCQEAYEAANEKMDRDIYPSHIRVHLLGDEYATAGIEALCDMVLRDQNFRIDVPLAVAQDAVAQSVLQAAVEQSTAGSEVLSKLIQENAKLGRTVETTVLDFIKESKEQGGYPLVACIRVAGKQEGKTELECSGAAIFSENRLVGYLDENQTLACQLVRGKPVQASLYLNQSGSSVEIERNKTQIQRSDAGAAVFVRLDVSVTGKKNIMDTEEILQETQSEVEQIIQNTIIQVQQQYGIDLFGIGNALQVSEQNIKVWEQEFAAFPVSVKVSAQLKNAGQTLQ